MRTLCGLVFLGFGIFVALATWLQTLLQPSGVSETAAGALLVGMVVAGIVGCAVLPPLVARRRTERGFMRAAVLVACLGCVLLGAAPWLGVRALALVAMGVVLLPALPVILTAAEQLAGAAAGTAGAIVWMAGNLGGLVDRAARAGPRAPSARRVPRDGRRVAARAAARGPHRLAGHRGAHRRSGCRHRRLTDRAGHRERPIRRRSDTMGRWSFCCRSSTPRWTRPRAPMRATPASISQRAPTPR